MQKQSCESGGLTVNLSIGGLRVSPFQAVSHGPELRGRLGGGHLTRLRRVERRERQRQLVMGYGLIRVHQAALRARVGRQIHSAWVSLW